MSLVELESKRAYSEIQSEEVVGLSNRTHFSNALNCVALAELFAAKAVRELRKVRINRRRLARSAEPCCPPSKELLGMKSLLVNGSSIPTKLPRIT